MQDIVILENDPFLLETFGFLFEEEGFQATFFDTPMTTLSYLRTLTTHVTVLFDGDVRGYQHNDVFLQSLVNDVALQKQHTYILMTTSNPLSDVTQQAVYRLHLPVVYKPFEVEDLLTTIRNAALPDTFFVA